MPKTTWFSKKRKAGKTFNWHPRIKGQLAYGSKRSGRAKGSVKR